MKDNVNYYEILGVSKKATNEEINKAYRIQAKKWHPDINKDSSAPDMFKELVEAKETLLDAVKRKEYDDYLENKINSHYSKVKNRKNSNTAYNEQPRQQTESYTKWEYFKLYLKYYQVSKFRKVLATIFVFLETIICKILEIINYIIVYTLAYLVETLIYAGGIFTGIFLVVLIINYGGIPISIVSDSLETNIMLLVLGILTVLIPPFLLKFCIEKAPMLISNLNVFLFKKSVGYK